MVAKSIEFGTTCDACTNGASARRSPFHEADHADRTAAGARACRNVCHGNCFRAPSTSRSDTIDLRAPGYDPDNFSNSIWIVPPGTAVLIPVGLEHAVRAPNNASIRILGIFPAVLEVKSPACRLLNLSPLIVALIESVQNFPRKKIMDGPQSRLVDVLLDQLRAAPDESIHLPRPRDQRARAVADCLARDPGDRMTLESWGRKVGASRRTLARLFQDETGMTFSVYRRQAQLSAAVGMLSSGASVTRVAQDLGYESTSAFVQMFRQAMQTTPGRYTASLSRATIR